VDLRILTKIFFQPTTLTRWLTTPVGTAGRKGRVLLRSRVRPAASGGRAGTMAMLLDRSATALCDQLDDVRDKVRRQVWSGARSGSPESGEPQTDTASPGGRSDAAQARAEARVNGRRVVQERRSERRVYMRDPHHPSVSSSPSAAAHDGSVGATPSYGVAARIPYPRELRHDHGTLTRARRKRAAARRAQSASAMARLRLQQQQAATERQPIELTVSCSELEGVPTAQPRQPKGAKLAVCVQARLLLWRGGRWELHGSTEPVRHGETPAFARTFILEPPQDLLNAPAAADTLLQQQEQERQQLQERPWPRASWEGSGMQCRVELHYRWGTGATDPARAAAGEALLGNIDFSLQRLVDTPGRCLATRLEPSGRLAVRAVPVSGGMHEQSTVRLRASLFDATAAAGASAGGAQQPETSASYFFTLSRDVGASASALSPFELIARSELITNRRTKTLGCRDFHLSAHKLCYGDLRTNLLASVFLYDPLGAEENTRTEEEKRRENAALCCCAIPSIR
jgi:hypothetical protein